MNRLKNDPLNIIICGIGGQGNILASDLIGSALVAKGYKVSVGETYGASQRGGSVMSHIRVSERYELGVLIPPGEADMILGFEPLETLRMLRAYGGERTAAIYDPRPVYPLGVLLGELTYPDEEALGDEIDKAARKSCRIKAAEIALACGNPKGANVALMGAIAASGVLPIGREDIAEAMNSRFKGAVRELNMKVFEAGIRAMEEIQGGAR